MYQYAVALANNEEYGNSLEVIERAKQLKSDVTYQSNLEALIKYIEQVVGENK